MKAILRMKRLAAFTLIELLVVITVLMIIVGLLLPAISAAIAKARQVRSSANLTVLYTAYMSRRKDWAIIPRLTQTPATGWAGLLLPYLNYDKKVFLAPGDDDPHYAGVDGVVNVNKRQAHGGKLPSAFAPMAPGFYITHFQSHETPDELKDENGIRYVCVVYYSSGHPDTDTEFTLKMGHISDGYREHTITINTELETLSIQHSGYDEMKPFWILDGKVDQLLLPLYATVDGTLVDNNNTTHDWSDYMVSRCSYGMSDIYGTDDRDIPMGEAVLLMEYRRMTIEAGGTNDVAWGPDDVYTGYRGRSSVLFSDGSVKVKKPEEIDPNDDAKWNLYWNPYDN